MTEAGWLACDDLRLLLEERRVRASQRKSRLFVCACCVSVARWLGPDSLYALDVAERFADGEASQVLLNAARDRARAAAKRANRSREITKRFGNPEHLAAQAVQLAVNEDPTQHALIAAQSCARAARRLGWDAIGPILREVYGNPYRLSPLNPPRRTADVLSLAHAAYEERNLSSRVLDPLRLAILADALEDAGCTDDMLLSHLRSPGPHVRGCWALDVVLGKE